MHRFALLGLGSLLVPWAVTGCLPGAQRRSLTRKDPVVVAVGDIVCSAKTDEASCRHRETLELTWRIAPAAVLVPGDLQYEKGEYEQFLEHFDPTWGRLNALIRPTPGDHEYLTPGASGYFDYFNGTGKASGPVGDRDRGYYSFSLGTWHLIALNSNCKYVGGCEAGSAQERWLRDDLAASSAACTLAYWHRPRFGSGMNNYHPSYQKTYQPFWEALYEHGAELVLSGHDHDYERFAPQTPAGEPNARWGIRQFVIGTGGRNLRPIGPNGRLPNSGLFQATHFGVLKLTLHPKRYDWEFISIDGTVIDSGSTRCHGAPH